ncbi:MAG: hypothetical protein DRP45_07075 [Candidatus Zixiibacteriota bacterium]|nr:MAG: hypothetical protein DRP45_07075 [candidate division Zixibacteria bacterium]
MRLFIIILILCLSAIPVTSVGQVECDILQCKLDRLYFPVGEEALVFEHAPFVILTGTDTVYQGRVDHAYEGISVSTPVEGFFDTLSLDSLKVVIETAAIDSSATIAIGTDIIGLDLLSPNRQIAESYAPTVTLRQYEHRSQMMQDFRSGFLDGYLSFECPGASTEGICTLQHMLPYIVALVPNVGRQCNLSGQLTTALYYLYDPARLSLYFDGSVQAVNRFNLHSAKSNILHSNNYRLFPYAPGRGKSLLSRLSFPPDSLSICASTRSLGRTAHYFADILAQSFFRVRLDTDRDNANIYVEYIPVSKSVPSTSMFALYHKLVQDTVGGIAASEQVRLISHYLDYVARASEKGEGTVSSDYYAYLDRAERVMIEELGVFPLFQPIVIFSAYKSLRNVRFDNDGFLDLSEAFKVVMPTDPEGTTP